MSDSSQNQGASSFPEAKVRRRYISAIWLLPVIAALTAGYLGLRSVAERGPEITVTFLSGEGLTAGQTPVKYKAVAIGTLQNISLNKDLSGITVHIRMSAAADPMLTENAKFWVVRPRLNNPSTTSLETLVSGTYIQIEPGDPGGERTTHFTGLETPPSISSDGPGTAYVLTTEKLGAISSGTPVFYRDLDVGEVLGYDIGDGFGPIIVHIVIHPPYNAFVKPSSRFWNASGLSVKLGNGGLHLELQSLQSVLQGGIAFYTPLEMKDANQAPAQTTFTLYDGRDAAEAAEAAASVTPVDYVTYIEGAVKDLAPGSPVEIFGIRVGQVTDVRLAFASPGAPPRVRIAFSVRPDRAFGVTNPDGDANQVVRQLVENGMRVRLESSDLILGQEILSLEFVPGAGNAAVTVENGALVLPGQTGGMDHITDALGDIAGKLNQIPFDDIGAHLDHLSAIADQTLAGPDMQQAIRRLEAAIANAEEISRKANTNLTPALQRLPQISQDLQDAIAHANSFMAGVDDSDLQRSSQRVMNEVGDAARSIRLLADFLERHPEALIQGKTPEKSKP